MTASAPPADDAHALKCELAADSLRLSGALRLQVTGWSMLPSVWPGDILLIERAEVATIFEGDIVMFARDRRLVAHRVVNKVLQLGNSQIITRGDAMSSPDSPISEVELLGKVSRIQRNGLWIEPNRNSSFAARAVAALVRRSELAARVVVGVHGMQQASSLSTTG